MEGGSRNPNDNSDDEVDGNVARKKVKISQRYCPRCNKILSYKTFKAHKRLYYDPVQSAWYTVAQCSATERQPSAQSSVCTPSLSPPSLSPLQDFSESELPIDDSPPKPHHDEGCFSSFSETSSDAPSGTLTVTMHCCAGKAQVYTYLCADTESIGIWSDESEDDLAVDEEPPCLQPKITHDAENLHGLLLLSYLCT